MPRICQVTISVDDIDGAIEFYSNKLGLEVLTRDFYPMIVPLRHEPFPIVLRRVERSAPRDYASEAQAVITFQTDDIGTSFQVLEAKGVEFIHDAPQPFPRGQYAAFRDPSGNILELMQFRQ